MVSWNGEGAIVRRVGALISCHPPQPGKWSILAFRSTAPSVKSLKIHFSVGAVRRPRRGAEAAAQAPIHCKDLTRSV